MERSSVWLVATLAALILSGDPAGAQPAEGLHFSLGSAVVELGGQVRLRVEDDHAFDVRGYRPAIDDRFLLSRVMLDASVRLSPRHRVFLELRDARETGSSLDEEDFPRNNPFADTLDIRQLFYEGLDLAGTGVSVRLGRQQMSYGDQRVFGPGQWGNTGRWAWDAAVVNLKRSHFDADAWVGRPVRNRPDRWPNLSVPEPVVAAAYVRVLKLPMRLDLFYVHKGDESGTTAGENGSGTLRSHSLGFQTEGTRGRLDYALTGVVGGADIAFYGYCNLFFWANLWDREVQVLLRPADRLDVHLQAHAFALASRRDAWYSTSLSAVRRDPSGASGTDLGDEIDLRAVYRIRPGVELMAGLGYFRPGSYVRRTGQARDALWRMAQASWSW